MLQNFRRFLVFMAESSLINRLGGDHVAATVYGIRRTHND